MSGSAVAVVRPAQAREANPTLKGSGVYQAKESDDLAILFGGRYPTIELLGREFDSSTGSAVASGVIHFIGVGFSPTLNFPQGLTVPSGATVVFTNVNLKVGTQTASADGALVVNGTLILEGCVVEDHAGTLATKPTVWVENGQLNTKKEKSQITRNPSHDKPALVVGSAGILRMHAPLVVGSDAALAAMVSSTQDSAIMRINNGLVEALGAVLHTKGMVSWGGSNNSSFPNSVVDVMVVENGALARPAVNIITGVFNQMRIQIGTLIARRNDGIAATAIHALYGSEAEYAESGSNVPDTDISPSEVSVGTCYRLGGPRSGAGSTTGGFNSSVSNITTGFNTPGDVITYLPTS